MKQQIRNAFGFVETLLNALSWTMILRELLDHVIPLSEDHLDKLLKEFIHYYNNSRSHLFRNKDSPLGRVYEPLPVKLYSPNAIPILGGLHHVYRWHSSSK
ncbi:MAG: hypothetical protein IPH52_05350 [Leptospiraceae bacterium]|nr:hypothetical protein [Leptospiraceae bacterium]